MIVGNKFPHTYNCPLFYCHINRFKVTSRNPCLHETLYYLTVHANNSFIYSLVFYGKVSRNKAEISHKRMFKLSLCTEHASKFHNARVISVPSWLIEFTKSTTDIVHVTKLSWKFIGLQARWNKWKRISVIRQ